AAERFNAAFPPLHIARPGRRKSTKTPVLRPFLVVSLWEVSYTKGTAGKNSAFHTALPNRGTRDIRSRRQGHLPEPWSRDRRAHRRKNHSWHHLRFLSSSYCCERHDRAGPADQRRRRRPAPRHR